MRKKFLKALALLAFAGAVGTCWYVTHEYQEKEIEERDAMITDLETSLACYERTERVYRMASDGKAGNECIATELEAVEVSADLVTEGMVADPSEVAGKHYLVDMPKGALLEAGLFEDFEVKDDMRYMDVILDEIPIGLEEGDFIDVRISFPLGQDYIAFAGKRVAQINGGTVKLIVDGRDFYYYESMKTDIATYRATRIYGAKYVEAGIQEKAQTYYPVNLEVLHTMLLDPNMDTRDYGSVIRTREQLEDQLLSSDRVDVSKTVTSGKGEMSGRFRQASEDYERLQAKKEKEAARDAAKEKE